MRLAWIATVLAIAPELQHVHGTREQLFPPRPEMAPGLRVELHTRDDRTTFHLFESIPVEIRVSSSSPRRYSIELDGGWNPVAGDVDFLLSPGDAVIKTGYLTIGGFACCTSHRVFLTHG